MHEIVRVCGCMIARPVSYNVVSRNWPRPDRCRSDSAIKDAIAHRARADVDQGNADPHRTACGEPVADIIPVMAWMIAS